MKWGSKEWANEQLRFALTILGHRLDGYECSDSGRIADALAIKKNLDECGFWWQVKILDCHIHRFRRDHKKSVVGLRRISRE